MFIILIMKIALEIKIFRPILNLKESFLCEKNNLSFKKYFSLEFRSFI